jgi:hypothetical protein
MLSRGPRAKEVVGDRKDEKQVEIIRLLLENGRREMGRKEMGRREMGRREMERKKIGRRMGKRKMERKMGRKKIGRKKMGKRKMGRRKMGRRKMGRKEIRRRGKKDGEKEKRDGAVEDLVSGGSIHQWKFPNVRTPAFAIFSGVQNQRVMDII